MEQMESSVSQSASMRDTSAFSEQAFTEEGGERETWIHPDNIIKQK